MERSFDVVVLGAGPAGETVAGRLGEAGLEVAIVEAHLVGGECSYYACMPSKALLRPAQVVAETRRVPGIATGPLDVEAVLRRRDEVVYDLEDSAQLPWLEQRGVTLVRGLGRLDGERRVALGGDVLLARRAVVLATGTGPLLPELPGLAEAAVWTNREGTNASSVPGRLLVLGGGVAGVEQVSASRTRMKATVASSTSGNASSIASHCVKRAGTAPVTPLTGSPARSIRSAYVSASARRA